MEYKKRNNRNKRVARKKKASVVWALDPYEKYLKPDKVSVDILSSRFHGNLKKIIPVYVAHNLSKEWDVDLKEDLKFFLNRVSRDQFRKAEILKTFSANKTKNNPIKELLRYAKVKGAELIAVSSSGQKGVKRLLFGSFAENLLKESKIPILFLTHNNTESHISQKILFATDFSKKSLAAYQEFLKFSKNFAYQVILYHLVTDKYFSVTAATNVVAGIPEYIPGNFFEEQMRWAEKEAKKWFKFTEKMMPKSEVKFIVQQGVSSVGPSILKIAEEENVGLIGISSAAGEFEKILVGSVAQEVFRSQSRPVWISGPQFSGKSKKL